MAQDGPAETSRAARPATTVRALPFALGWPRDDVACWLRAVPLDDAATELLRWIDRETLSHLMLQAGMHTYPPKLVVASQEELVHLATAQLEADHVQGRVVLDRTAAVLVAAAVTLGASAASVARARALWPPMLGPRPRPPPDVWPPAPALLPHPTASSWSPFEPAGMADGSSPASSTEDSSLSNEDPVCANAQSRSAPEARDERAAMRELHPNKMDFSRHQSSSRRLDGSVTFLAAWGGRKCVFCTSFSRFFPLGA